MEEPETPVVQPRLAIYKLSEDVKHPVGSFYTPIKWGGIFSDLKLVRFATPADGSCLFHAIANSFFAPYHTEILKDKPISRTTIISCLRSELAEKLGKHIDDNPKNPTYYDTLHRGTTKDFAEFVPEFKLEHMQKELNSENPIGYGYLEYIGNIIDKDIYILEAQRGDIYKSDELSLTIKGDRKSIILYYMNGHYELVGLKKEDGTFDTHFDPSHSFIRKLYDRVQEKINEKKE